MNISDINKYKKYIENGIYENRELEYLADRYSEQERQSISYLDILFSSSRANTIIKNNVTYKCIVDYGVLPKKSSNTQSLQNRELWTRSSDELNAGDIVSFAHNPYDVDKRKNYILINKIETRIGYELHVMQPCISSLKWLDENGQVCEAPFSYRLDFYRGSGTDDGKVIVIPQERRYIYVQRNDDTLKIKRDKRFIFDGRVWKVTAYDTLLSGLIYFELEEDEINPAVDNVELRIADYIISSTPEENQPSEEGYSILINGNDSCKLNMSQTYKAEVFNDSILDETKFVSWQLLNEDNTGTTDLVSVISQGENKIIIKANNQNKLGSVSLKASLLDDSSIIAVKQIQVKGVM